MKIAIVTPTFPPYPGGIGNVAFYHARELRQYAETVRIFTPAYPGTSALSDDPNVVRMPPAFSYGNGAFVPRLAKLVAGFDVVALHYPFFGGAEVLWRAANELKREGTRFVIHYQMDVSGRGLFKLLFFLHRRLLLQKILEVADGIVVSSFDYAKNSDLAGLFEREPEKCAEIPNGVDTTIFQSRPKSEALLSRHQIEPDEKVALFVGGLDPAHYFKGVEYLIKAVNILPRRAARWRLIIVGRGSLRARYEAMAADMGLADRVIFTGFVSDEELPLYYNLADVVILPSIDRSESFGLVLVEAMASGKPVIASNLPGVRSVVVDGQNGFLVEPADIENLSRRIGEILGSASLERTLGENGLERARALYDWQGIGRKVFQYYQQICQQTGQ